jgi:hypothetical protein
MHSGRCCATESLVDRQPTLSCRRTVDNRRDMENFTGRCCEFFLDHWQAATFFDFCMAASLIVICGWLASRVTSQ